MDCLCSNLLFFFCWRGKLSACYCWWCTRAFWWSGLVQQSCCFVIFRVFKLLVAGICCSVLFLLWLDGFECLIYAWSSYWLSWPCILTPTVPRPWTFRKLTQSWLQPEVILRSHNYSTEYNLVCVLHRDLVQSMSNWLPPVDHTSVCFMVHSVHCLLHIRARHITSRLPPSCNLSRRSNLNSAKFNNSSLLKGQLLYNRWGCQHHYWSYIIQNR